MRSYWKQFVEWATGFRNNPFILARLKLTFLYTIVIIGGIIFYITLLNREFTREALVISKEVPDPYRKKFIHRATRLTTETLFTIQPEDILMFFVTVGISYSLAGLSLKPLKKIVETQKHFLADASHELRTPLSIVKMDLEVFLQETVRNFTSKKHLLEMRHQSARSNLEELDRMQQMLDNLLILSREDVYKEVIVYKQYNLATTLSQIITRLHDSAKRKNINLFINGDEDISINGDPIRMEQAILNIVKNAIKYTPAGGAIAINFMRSGSQIKIIISDNGIGIAEKDLPHVFKRFFRVKDISIKKIDGMGIGLTITKMIIEKHKGKVEIQSTLGKGTTVTIYLPQSKRTYATISS